MRYSFFKTETRRSGQLIVMLKLRGVVQIQMTKIFKFKMWMEPKKEAAN
jgi:hypothetical protein